MDQTTQYYRRAMKIYLPSCLYQPGQINNPALVEAIGRLLLSTQRIFQLNPTPLVPASPQSLLELYGTIEQMYTCELSVWHRRDPSMFSLLSLQFSAQNKHTPNTQTHLSERYSLQAFKFQVFKDLKKNFVLDFLVTLVYIFIQSI